LRGNFRNDRNFLRGAAVSYVPDAAADAAAARDRETAGDPRDDGG
jgi:hypothetical protein